MSKISRFFESIKDGVVSTERDIEMFPPRLHLWLMIIGLTLGFLIVLYLKIKS